MEKFVQTDIGLSRDSNQDAVYGSESLAGPLPCLFLVADGMGGHAAGDLASRLCVETVVSEVESSEEKGVIRVLDRAIRAANRAVYDRASSDISLDGMGTTLVAATIVDRTLYCANIGDSRLYVIDDDRIDQITHDHSLVEEMVRSGRLRREQARNHPEKNIITRAIGEGRDVQIDFFDVALNPGDTLLLCSDGLTNMLEDRQIFRIIKKEGDLEAAGTRLIEEANHNGGRDNISVILVRIPLKGEEGERDPEEAEEADPSGLSREMKEAQEFPKV